MAVFAALSAQLGSQLGSHVGAHAGTATLAESPVGNLVLIGFSVVGLLGAAALLGTAKDIHDRRSDPLNDRHYINF
jgi:hypothetical protein